MRQLLTGAGAGGLLIVGCAFALLNALGGIVGGIWLCVSGEWRLVAFGFALSFLMPWAWLIATSPVMLALMLAGEEPRRGPVLVVATFSALWNSLAVSAWVLSVLAFFLPREAPQIPLLLFAYGTIMSPLAYMAGKERGEGSTASGLGLFQAAMLSVASLTCYLLEAGAVVTWWVVGVVTFVGALGFWLLAATAAVPTARADELF